MAFGMNVSYAQGQSPDIRVLVVASSDPDHDPMIVKAKPFFEKLAADHHFRIDFTRDSSQINEHNLINYEVLIALHLAPFDLTPQQQMATQNFIERGKGFIAVHAAGLTGKDFLLPGTPYWQWFEQAMGDAVYSPHPALQKGTVVIEDRTHPVTKNLPASFSITDEWYEFDKSPRANVHVLATADEATYNQNKPMGDHPMIWTSEDYARLLYIGIGHDASVCADPNFTILMRDAISWAATPDTTTTSSKKEETKIFANQVAYDLHGSKKAVISSTQPLGVTAFQLIHSLTTETVFEGTLSEGQEMKEWFPGTFYYNADFSSFRTPGYYRLVVNRNGKIISSFNFQIEEHAIARHTLPAIATFFKHQRADSPQELEADKKLILFGSTKTVDLHGGWCDASGDISKYFSHLAYANFMSPQQIPLVTWSMVNATERASGLLTELKAKEPMMTEAIYGADYLMRSLSAENYFYMTVFSYFDKNPGARRVVGLLADSKTTSDYQCAFREGAGMAIASLARISLWQRDGDFSSKQYLDGAERAFAHLLKNNTKYDDDGKENIIDDYCALMAASELWIATNKTLYRDQARKRAQHLANRMTAQGYFISNDTNRPFWHAADAGLPVIALARYLDKEADFKFRADALATIKKALDYNLTITHAVTNPFGYARQSFLYKGEVEDGFFIPHDNETGWWWQGENARLGSLAAAAIVGGRLVYPDKGALGTKEELSTFASNQVSWILGRNPYDMCFMFRFGKNNVPYMSSMFGHGSGTGGISNGITGKDGKGDGSGIDFKEEDQGNEWRWTEQWIPHSGWFLQAVTAMATDK